ncbi:MAG: hypothetical protein KKF52_01405 [Nanoarchaeota archaeon]|nr:hypothetical protein [Nanoarchaeota archaeon]MBU4241866.1 hypothetical protein [Nanoarchaeota archaeon]
MRKKRILLIILLLTLFSKLVAAQDIIIAGKSYPLIIFIPFVLIVLIWVIILIIWSLRNKHNIALVIFNIGKSIGRFLSLIGFQKLSIKLAELREKRLKATEAKRRLLIERDEEKFKDKEEKKLAPKKKDLTPFLEKVALIENQLPKSKEDLVFKNLAEVIKSFFATLLNLQHQFTESELQEILEKKKKGLVEFTQKLAELKYSGQPLTKQELKDLIDEFKQIVQHYVKAGWKPGKEKITAMEKIVTQDKKILTNIKGYIDFLKQESRKSEIESLLEEESKVLSKNIRLIKKRYNKMLKLYVQLSPREKSVVYPQLIDFYNRINKSLFSTVYSKKSKEELEYFTKKLDKLKSAPKKESFLLKLKKAFAPKEKVVQIPIKGKKLKVKIPVSKEQLLVPKQHKESFFKKLFQEKPRQVKIPKVKQKKVDIKKSKEVKDSLGHKFTKLFKKEQVPIKKLSKVILPEPPKEIKLKEIPAPKPSKPLPSMEPLFKKLVHVFHREQPSRSLRVKEEKIREKLEKQMLQKKQVELDVKKIPSEEQHVIEQLDKLIQQPKIEKVDYLSKIRQDIDDGRKYLRADNLEAAEKVYDEIRVYFATLEPEDREKIYNRILKYFGDLEISKEKLRSKELRVQERENRIKQRESEKRLKLEVDETLAKKEVEKEENSLESEERKLREALEHLNVPRPAEAKTYITRVTARDKNKILKEIEDKKERAKEEAERRKKREKAMKQLESEEERIARELEKLKKFL